MEEDLLKYFTGQGNPTTETIKPQNVSLKYVPCKQIAVNDGLVVNNQYYIRYGGTYSQSTPSNNYAAIEVYTIDTLDKGEALYIFDDLKINGNFLLLEDLHQAEDGRFYGVGMTLSNNDIINEYLIIFNNFIQDGRLKINKYYSKTEMGLTQNDTISKVIKKENSGDYYFLSSGFVETNVAGIFIYHYKIDILEGNKLETYKIKYDSNSFMNLNTYTGASKSELKLINDNLVYMGYFKRTDTETPYREEYHSIVLKEPKEDEIYQTKIIKTINIDYSTNLRTIIEDYLFKSLVLIKEQTPGEEPQYILRLYIVDLDGNTIIIYPNPQDFPDLVFDSPDIPLRLKGNYLIVPDGSTAKFYYFDFMNISLDPTQYTYFIKFYEASFSGYFLNLQILKKYNLISLIGYGGSGGTILSYEKNIFSDGYSSMPYYNNNFMVPQYLNLYSGNDESSLMFSRDVSNRFVAGNQITTTFNIPNYLLNEETIKREKVNSQTNLTIEDDMKDYSKNRFESLYMTYIYNMYVKDNTNNDNLINQEGSNRVADSIWNRLDYQASPLSKARITYENQTQEIINIGIPTLNGNIATYNFNVEGNIIKIEYMSNDENTIYATYRCNLTGTNTITQTIEVMEG